MMCHTRSEELDALGRYAFPLETGGFVLFELGPGDLQDGVYQVIGGNSLV